MRRIKMIEPYKILTFDETLRKNIGQLEMVHIELSTITPYKKDKDILKDYLQELDQVINKLYKLEGELYEQRTRN